MTLEEQFREMIAEDPRYTESPGIARARGIFLLGAQAVLESVRCNAGSPASGLAVIQALAQVNAEIGEWLGITDAPRAPH